MSDEDLPLIPYDELARDCLADIVTWNNMPHSQQDKYPGKTRWDVFLENQHPDLRPINWDMILPYIGNRTETSCKAGTIKLQRKEFFLGLNGKISTGEELVGLMDMVDGKELDVYWLDDNNGEVLRALVYLRDGNRIMCEAFQDRADRPGQGEHEPRDVLHTDHQRIHQPPQVGNRQGIGNRP